MKVKIKKIKNIANYDNIVIPSYSKERDACMDLTAIYMVESGRYIEYGTGLMLEIPKGFFGLVRPRSSVSNKDLAFATSGIIDSEFRGHITIRFKRLGDSIYHPSDRVAQLMILPYPNIDWEEVDELSTTERGEGGYGSTGK